MLVSANESTISEINKIHILNSIPYEYFIMNQFFCFVSRTHCINIHDYQLMRLQLYSTC